MVWNTLVEDITVIKQLEDERLRIRELIQKTEKNLALADLAGSVIHEISNPLAIIHGCSKRMLKNLGELEKNATTAALIKDVDRIEYTVARINSVILSLKNISGKKSQAAEVRSENLSELFQEAIQNYTDSRDQRDIIDIRLQPENLDACVSKIEFVQVIGNLLKNSLYELKISQSMDKNRCGKVNDKICIRFTDSGKVPDLVAEKMFNEMFTTKPLDKGTGLGLILSKKLIEFMGGRMQLNRQSENTQFIITLPARKPV
ncbi:MAG: HAMP domain-containing sensor histidine kinase [Bdellovibrionales bacterium]